MEHLGWLEFSSTFFQDLFFPPLDRRRIPFLVRFPEIWVWYGREGCNIYGLWWYLFFTFVICAWKTSKVWRVKFNWKFNHRASSCNRLLCIDAIIRFELLQSCRYSTRIYLFDKIVGIKSRSLNLNNCDQRIVPTSWRYGTNDPTCSQPQQ